VACGFDDLDAFHAGVVEAGGDEVRGSPDVTLVSRLGADAGDPEKLLQLIQEAFLVLIYVVTRGLRHLPL
jgi:hypothetical protein